MLKTLTIHNYAIIDHIELDLNKGFSIITGETGAGKSILLGALSLITGQRADTSMLKTKDEKCIVEAVFDISEYELGQFFKEKLDDIDYETVCIIRRMITPNGKSRAFINDNPVNLNLLKEFSQKLIDIHSQHNTLLLKDNSFQLKLIDGFAQHKDLLVKYVQNFTEYKKVQHKYQKLLKEAETSKKQQVFYQEKFDELDKANLSIEEQTELETEQATLAHAEEIKSNLQEIAHNLNNEDSGAVILLNKALKASQAIESFYPNAKEFSQRLDSSLIELNDLANETETEGSSIEYEEERANFVNERLSLIYNLQKKHQVETIEELLDLKNKLQKELERITNFDFHIEELEKERKKQQEQLLKIALQISTNRKKVFPKIEGEIKVMLTQLGMPNAIFKIKHQSIDFTDRGIDELSFLFSANKNIAPEEIANVASGGEMSRLMLSIKALLSQSIALPTIIFDEIDTGVSGDIADKMGTIMKKMSDRMQVISITHLPQVAAKGLYHYKVYKKDDKETTYSQIELLNKEDRLKEIAKMLSGKNITDAARDNAKVLLEN